MSRLICISLDHAHREILPAEVGKGGLKYDSKFKISDGIDFSGHNYICFAPLCLNL